MPQLTIDGQIIEVTTGTKVIEAAERLGIMIPRFCYHPALGSVGACRMCAVMFLEGPVKGLEMSCMIEAKDGMVVSTDHPDAVRFRRQIIEWLMTNHPHDCPVCDEGGHCFLQDMTVSGGHSIRRFQGLKRTHVDQYLGPLVQHEMNRCIQCYRCVRFYQEYAGYRDLGVMGISGRVYFGRFENGTLESPFAGNLIDLCPTGVYTDKPSRFKARRWDLERADSICLHCSLGCNIVAGARYRAVIRLEAKLNETINGYFICDRGRYGYEYTNLENRPREARIDGRSVAPDEAVIELAARLKMIVSENGAESVACLGSTRSSLESMGALKRLCRLQGWRPPEFFMKAKSKAIARSCTTELDPALAVSLNDLGQADCILAVGVDPLNEAPMLAMAMRQAARRGADMVVIDPRPIQLPFPFQHMAAGLHELDNCLSALIKTNCSRPDASIDAEMAEWWDSLPAVFPEGAEPLKIPSLTERKYTVIVCGADIVPGALPGLSGQGARFLLRMNGRAGLFFALIGPNDLGAALLEEPSPETFDDMIKAVETGKIKALLVLENDPLGRYVDPARIESALSKLDVFAVMDFLPSKTTAKSRIFLPTQTLFESGGSFLNNEGRLQHAWPVHAVGLPIKQTGDGGHPPREFTQTVPGGAPLPGWNVLEELARELEAHSGFPAAHPWEYAAAESEELAAFPSAKYPFNGVKVQPKPRWLDVVADTPPDIIDKFEEFDILYVDRTFGTEELSGYGPTPAQLVGPPEIFLNEVDAHEFKLADGDKAPLPTENGTVIVILRAVSNMARKTIIVPRRFDLGWPGLRPSDLLNALRSGGKAADAAADGEAGS